MPSVRRLIQSCLSQPRVDETKGGLIGQNKPAVAGSFDPQRHAPFISGLEIHA